MASETLRDFRWAWRTSLTFFVLAGLTGFLFRLELTYGGSFGMNLVNVRHAHSHLMYFGWATPALMLGMTAFLAEGIPAGRSERRLAILLS